MSQTSSDLAASVVAGEMAVLVGVPLGSVQSILITVDRIEVHRVGSDDDDQPEDAGSEGSGSEGSGTEGEGEDGTEDDDEGSGAWISVDLVAGGVTVDLVGMSPQEIASDAVPGGTYNKLRLFFSASTITFSEDVTVGGGLTYEADTVYDLEIPSGANTAREFGEERHSQSEPGNDDPGHRRQGGLHSDLTRRVSGSAGPRAGRTQLQSRSASYTAAALPSAATSRSRPVFTSKTNPHTPTSLATKGLASILAIDWRTSRNASSKASSANPRTPAASRRRRGRSPCRSPCDGSGLSPACPGGVGRLEAT